MAPAAELAGNWDLRIDGTTIFRFTIERTDSGGWQGRWQRPDSFNSNGNAFANLRGPVKSTASMAGNAVFELVELAFDDPRPGAVPDIFRFRLIGPDAAAMLYVGTQLPPYLLVRAGADDPLGNWDSTRIYRRNVPGAPRPAAAPDDAPPPAPEAAATRPQPRTVAPTPDGRIILGRQVQFLDLTPRENAAAEAAETQGEAAAAQSADAPTAAPASPTSAPAPPAQPQVDEDFLEGL